MIRLLYLKLGFLCLLQLICFRSWAANKQVKQLEEELKSITNPNEQIDIYYQLSKELSFSDLDLATFYAKKGIQVATENKDPRNIARLTMRLGRVYLEEGKVEDALKKLQRAIEIAEKNKFKEEQADIRLNLGYYWYRLGDSANTMNNYQKAFKLYSELDSYDGVARAYLKLGWGFDAFANHKEAEKSFREAIKMKSKISDSTLMINILSGMGSFYINKSIKQDVAIQYFEEALQIAKLQGKKYFIGRMYNALGFLYSGLDKIDAAKSFYLQGLEIFKELDNKTELAWLYMRIGELYAGTENFDEALNYYGDALMVADQVDRSVLQKAEINMAMGMIHSKRDKDYEKALQLFQESLSLAKQTDNSYIIMKNELAVGNSYLSMGRIVEGKEMCNSAYIKASNHLSELLEACNCLYKAEQKLGDYKAAIGHLEMYNTLKDSLHKEELSEKINNLAAKQAYEMELAKVQKAQVVESANLRVRSTTIIGIISVCAVLIIMFLWLSNVKKNAQKKQLQAHAIVRKEMMANVSHDLRTPLTVMTGYVETMLMRVGNIGKEEQEKYLKIILNSSDRLSHLVGQLFEYSKLEAQQIEPTKEAFQLEDLVKNTFARYEILAQKKEINIQLDCVENIPVVYADAILIDRVIQNLMDNALKFTPKYGTISICLSNNNEKVQVEIADTGEGIPKEMEQLIFERYEKSKTSRGAGLGLTIVKNILEMHGSSIQVKSQLNKGTSFAFSLPTL